MPFAGLLQKTGIGENSMTAKLLKKEFSDESIPKVSNMPEDMDTHFISGPQGSDGMLVDIPQGTILMDRYLIHKHIGTGRTGSVYSAKDKVFSTEVALKVVSISPSNKVILEKTLKWEMAVYKHIRDFENIIKASDIQHCTWGGMTLNFITMEYANGGTFRNFLEDLSLDVNARQTLGIEYFKQICRSVASLHGQGIYYLDLKPENLLLCGDTLKISDMGSAYCSALKNDNVFTDIAPHFLEQSTPVYMSPEQFVASHPDDLDARSDIYSLGIILYELLNPKCRPPFTGPYEKVRSLHLEANPQKLKGVEERLMHIVNKCLKKDPDERYQTCNELLMDLEGGHSTTTTDMEEDDNSYDVEEMWRKANHLYTQGYLNESFQLLEHVLAEMPDSIEAKSLMKSLRFRFNQAAEFYHEVDQNIKNSDLNELIELLDEAVHIYPNHPSGALIQKKLAVRAEKYEKTMEEGVFALKHEHWEAALSFFEEALTQNSEAREVKMIVQSLLRICNLRDKINKSLNNNEYETALKLARTVDFHVHQMKTTIPALKG